VFARPDEEEVLRAHLHDPPPGLRPRVPGWLPAELEALVVACLAKDPAQRPASAGALAAALRAIEVPAAEAWTEGRAAAWWLEHRPPPSAPARTVATTAPVRVVVARGEALAASSSAPTVRG
jgi:hypothetical protein